MATEAGTPADAGHAPAIDAAFFHGVDAGDAPPEYCVAPCVWEMVQRCLPDLRSCATGDVGVPDGIGSIVCDETTGWSVTSAYTMKTMLTTYGRDGVDCLKVSDFGVPAVRTDYVDFTGAAATDVLGIVYCVSFSDIDLNDPPPGYVLDRSRPECRAWDAGSGGRERGIFPTGTLACASSEAGACPATP